MKKRYSLPFLFLPSLILVLFSSTSCKKDNSDLIPKISDIDGNEYQTIVIGTQTWMKENLKTTRYNDGTDIPLVADNTGWSKLTTPAYCWYDNDPNNGKNYGALYNWYTVETEKLCPQGWHVPDDDDWTVLTNYLGGEGIAGAKLKEIGTINWNDPNVGASNESGFSALPGGERSNFDGKFYSLKNFAAWWSTSETSSNVARFHSVNFNDTYAKMSNFPKATGFSVRCVKD